MKVRQSAVLEKLRGEPGGLQKLFETLKKRDSKESETVTVDGKTYVIRKSPMVTERTGY